MKYNVGDRVRIKSLDWYNENKDENGNIVFSSKVTHFSWRENVRTVFTKDMAKFCGKVVTIEIVWTVNYSIVEGTHRDYFTDEMIEGLVEEEIKPEPKFKVGDKVILDPYPCVVTDVNWRDSLHGFVYTVRGADFGKMVGEEDLVLDESEKKLSDESWRYKNIFDSSQYPQSFECPEGYKFVDENGTVINATKIVLEKKKNEYPKTYEECEKVLSYDSHRLDNMGVTVRGYKWELIRAFQILLICRDAYWQIAGAEMGLGKPWEPDWNISGYYGIARSYGNVIKTSNYNCDLTFVFPTEEMRDAFYENFKVEIEICKELL